LAFPLLFAAVDFFSKSLFLQLLFSFNSKNNLFEVKGVKRREGNMGILEAATPLILICTRDRVRAIAFYRDKLGLKFISEDRFAAVFEAGGTMLRVSTVADFVAHEHSILGFRVADTTATVKSLRENGVVFNIYPSFKQDELVIWTVPDGSAHVAWFKDPDGNVLSITDV
jgi:catechol 2,3-dioxygenase-like lactoylglutathione lyase family enzyme